MDTKLNKNRREKQELVERLKDRLARYDFFYIMDVSGLDANATNELRQACQEVGVEVKVAKNTLVRLAMEASDRNFEELYDVLEGPTSLFFTETSNAPAKLAEKFRKTHDKPTLKAAYLEEALYKGDDQLKVLANLKSKEEMVGEIVNILRSPLQNVMQGLKSGGDKLSGLVKALAEKEDKK